MSSTVVHHISSFSPPFETAGLTPVQVQVVAALAEGRSVVRAAAASGIHRSTIHNWIRTSQQFCDAVNQARSHFHAIVADQLNELSGAALDTLRQLQQQFRGDPDAALPRDIGTMIRDLQRLDPSVYQNDPVLAERINGAMLGNIEQVEMQLRRKAEQGGGDNGAVRGQSGEAVPQGYSDAVAEYFRRLSKGK